MLLFSVVSPVPKRVTALIDLSVRRRGVLTQETWIERSLMWAERHVTTRIAGWKPKAVPKMAWLQKQIHCLPTIARFAREGVIALYTYSELHFEEWAGRPEMMNSFGDLFSDSVRTCEAAVNKPRFRGSVDFSYYLDRNEMIEFCDFLLRARPEAFRNATSFWNALPSNERDNLLRLEGFQSTCYGLSKNHYPDAFHLWTAETNHLDYFLMMDRKFSQALSTNHKLRLQCRVVSPDELLNSPQISERDPYPYPNYCSRTYYE